MKGYSLGQVVCFRDEIIQIKHNVDWELKDQQKHMQIIKYNIRKNRNQFDHDYKLGDTFMLDNNDAYKYEMPYKGQFFITRCWTNGVTPHLIFPVSLSSIFSPQLYFFHLPLICTSLILLLPLSPEPFIYFLYFIIHYSMSLLSYSFCGPIYLEQPFYPFGRTNDVECYVVITFIVSITPWLCITWLWSCWFYMFLSYRFFIGLFCGLYVIIMVWLSLCFIFFDLSFLIYFSYFRKTHDKF